MSSKYALQGNNRERVLFVAGICYVLAAQAERRRQRTERRRITLFATALYLLFAANILGITRHLGNAQWVLAMLDTACMYVFAAGMALTARDGDQP